MEESGNQNLYGGFQNGQLVTHNTHQQNQNVVTRVQIPTEDSKMATISHPEIKTLEKTGTEIFKMATNLYTEETLLKCSRTIRERDFILKMATTSYTTGTSLPVTLFINFNLAAKMREGISYKDSHKTEFKIQNFIMIKIQTRYNQQFRPTPSNSRNDFKQ